MPVDAIACFEFSGFIAGLEQSRFEPMGFTPGRPRKKAAAGIKQRRPYALLPRTNNRDVN
jgi:hypothetical protein